MRIEHAQTRRTFLATFAGASAMVLAACGSGSDSGEATDAADATTEAAAGGTADTEKGDGVMTFDEYVAAAVDDEVVIEAYVQGKQSWYEETASLYLQDADGGYFVYAAACSQDDYDKLVDGQKVKVTGYKADFSGEVEIADGSFEIEDGTYVAAATDVTDKLGTEELIDFQNQKVSFTDMTVEPSELDGKEVAFLYNWDGSGAQGDDLYFNVSKDGATYSFTVESYLCDQDSDVYKAVEALAVGDTVDLEGFLYWYEGANPHITSVTVK